MGKIRTTRKLTTAQGARIRTAIDGLIQELAAELSLDTQTVANSVFYRLQGHPIWGRNPSSKRKSAGVRPRWRNLLWMRQACQPDRG